MGYDNNEFDEEQLEELAKIIEEMEWGTVLDVLPKQIDGNVAIGLSVAIDSFRKGEYKRGVRALEKSIDIVEREHIEED